MYLPLQKAFYEYIDTELSYTARSPVYKGRVSLLYERRIARNKAVNLTCPVSRGRGGRGKALYRCRRASGRNREREVAIMYVTMSQVKARGKKRKKGRQVVEIESQGSFCIVEIRRARGSGTERDAKVLCSTRRYPARYTTAISTFFR